MQREFVSEKELEEMTGISRHTWRKWRSQGKGPRYLKLGGGRGGRVIYGVSDFTEFILHSIIETDGQK